MAEEYDPYTGELPPKQEAAEGEVLKDDEILPPQTVPEGRAADGGIVPAAANTGGQFLDMLDEGRFSAELAMELSKLGMTMTDLSNATGNKTKGKVQITLDLTCEDGAFKIGVTKKVTAPELPRPRTILWTDEDNGGRFGRYPPNQMQFFGMKNAQPSQGTGPVRQV